MSDLLNRFGEGGIFIFMILTLSIAALTLIVRKSLLLVSTYRLNRKHLTRSIIQQIDASNFARAIQYCNVKVHPLTAILRAALLKANKSEKEIRRAIDTIASDEIPKFKRGIAALPHLSNVCTMLGLLGTIRGLIVAFSGMAAGDSARRQEALSSGIAIAFQATFFALSVAAAIVLAYVILNAQQNKALAEMEHAANTVVSALVEKNRERQPPR